MEREFIVQHIEEDDDSGLEHLLASMQPTYKRLFEPLDGLQDGMMKPRSSQSTRRRF
jgi:hypothetical protein